MLLGRVCTVVFLLSGTLGVKSSWAEQASGPAFTAQVPASAGPEKPKPQPRVLSLREALDLALQSDPSIPSAVAGRERRDLGVLRAELDRFSLRVDSFLTEQWRASNLGGSAPAATCAALLPTAVVTGGALFAPVQLLSSQGNAPTPSECEQAMGQYVQPDVISQGWLGQFNLSANLQVPLFTGFRITSNISRARHLRDAEAATVQDIKRQVAFSALRAYYTVRRIEAQEQVSEQAIARYNESVAVISARARAGLAAPADVNRMEMRRQAEFSRLADLRGSAAESRAQLSVALGLGGTPLVLSESLEMLPSPPQSAEDVEALLATALRERPDLRSAHLVTLAAQDFVRFQLSSYYPQFAVSSLLQFSNNPYNPLIGARVANAAASPFTNITGSLFVGGTLSINLFDTLNTLTSVRDARLEHRRLVAEERRLGRAIESDVRTFHARLLHYYGMREPLLRTRDIALDNLKIIERRYKNGDVAILDFIDAQVELLNAEINLVNSQAMIAETWGELYLSTGRLPP